MEALTGLLGGLWGYVAIAGAGVVTLLLAFLGIRKGGKDSIRAKQAQDAAKRGEKGRQAAGKASGDLRSGKSPEDVVRENDGGWS